MRPRHWSCQPLPEEAASDTPEAATSCEHADKLLGDISDVGAKFMADKASHVPRGQTPRSGNSDTAFGNPQPNRDAAEDRSTNVHKFLPQVPPALLATRVGYADLNHDGPNASVGATCHRCPAPAVFSQEFSHLELDALLGPKCCWKDPFEVCAPSEVDWV